jgi:GNAT superfamily N-acetyltransferase
VAATEAVAGRSHKRLSGGPGTPVAQRPKCPGRCGLPPGSRDHLRPTVGQLPLCPVTILGRPPRRTSLSSPMWSSRRRRRRAPPGRFRRAATAPGFRRVDGGTSPGRGRKQYDQYHRLDDEPVGRLRVTRTSDHVELCGLQLRPRAQRRGIGTAIIEDLKQKPRRPASHQTLAWRRTTLMPTSCMNVSGSYRSERPTKNTSSAGSHTQTWAPSLNCHQPRFSIITSEF